MDAMAKDVRAVADERTTPMASGLDELVDYLRRDARDWDGFGVPGRASNLRAAADTIDRLRARVEELESRTCSAIVPKCDELGTVYACKPDGCGLEAIDENGGGK